MLAASLIVLSCAGELQGGPEDYPCSFQGASACNAGAAPSTGGAGGAGPGTGGAGPGTGGSAALPPDDPCLEAVFAASCASFCHKPGAGVALGESLNLTGGNYGMKMANVPATYQSVPPADMPKCKAGAFLIDRANKAESVLTKKLAATQACGSSMPIGAPLTPDQLACIQNWVMKF